MFGIDRDENRYKDEKSFYDSLFKDPIVFNLTRESAKLSSEIYWNLAKRGISIEKFDCIIAATLMSHGISRIITRNVKHFNRIPGLKALTY